MITVEKADRILNKLFYENNSLVEIKWYETAASTNLMDELICRGLQTFETLFPENTVGVLHGWIDQAVLEIIAIGPLPELKDKVMSYRADQGGDTGILALNDETVIVFEISFEQCEVKVCKYE
ncbi:hypothetical protein [uncultured Rubinisphaera sp.]|uniref:hypothetical protein n=1 Tax=uncultured Rubinisphaera sp. TaxID=1678686 RepID=UPI0030DA6CA7